MNYKVLFTSLLPLILCFALVSCIVDDIIVPDSERVVSEDYMPFAEEGKVWVYGSTRIDYNNIPEQYRYQICGDTILNDRHYKKMFICEEDRYGDSQMHYIGAVRDTLLKVQFVDKGQRKERLLYDFGLQSGNMMRWYGYTLIAGYGNNNFQKNIEGKLRHYWNVYSSDNKFSDTWIEGIGGAKYQYTAYEPTDKSQFMSLDPIKKRKSILIRCEDSEGCCYDCRTDYQRVK